MKPLATLSVNAEALPLSEEKREWLALCLSAIAAELLKGEHRWMKVIEIIDNDEHHWVKVVETVDNGNH